MLTYLAGLAFTTTTKSAGIRSTECLSPNKRRVRSKDCLSRVSVSAQGKNGNRVFSPCRGLARIMGILEYKNLLPAPRLFHTKPPGMHPAMGYIRIKIINRMPRLLLRLPPSFSRCQTPLYRLTGELNRTSLIHRIWELLNSHSLYNASFKRRPFRNIISVSRRICTLRIFAALDSRFRALPVDAFIELYVVFCTSGDGGIGVKKVVPLEYGSIGVSGDRPVVTAAANIFAAGAKFAGYFWNNVAVELWYRKKGAADYTQGDFSRTVDIGELRGSRKTSRQGGSSHTSITLAGIVYKFCLD